VVSFETAIYQWQQGERRLAGAPAERAQVLERVTSALVAELRRRLGGRFSTEELVELYEGGTAWCLQVAMKHAPEDPWAWEAGVVVDAAFGRYLRDAADDAGGRRTLSEAQ
jgi:DNA-binding transcriptional regulator YdaS (Cro superfamily)